MLRYTDKQRTLAIELRFRDHVRPQPWRTIACAIKVNAPDHVIERMLWGVVTGGSLKGGTRTKAPQWPPGRKLCRAGMPWHGTERVALKQALNGEGQERVPKVDVPYIAQVLARTEEEVEAEHKRLIGGGLKRKGFF
jgi:hypothetical protein